MKRVLSSKRGQAGIEYVILVGVLLVFLIPTIYYSLNEANQNVRLSQIENAARRLVKAADSVHALGPGSIEIITISLPNGVENITIGNKTVLFRMSIFGGTSDVHFPSSANLTGELPIEEGTYTVRVESLQTREVNITQRT